MYCIEPKFLQCPQSLMASKMAALRLGHHMLSVSAILIESLHQWPLPMYCFRASAWASTHVMHSTHAHPCIEVPPFNHHSFPSSIVYWEAWWPAHFQSWRLVDLSSMAQIESITSRNSGSPWNCSWRGLEILLWFNLTKLKSMNSDQRSSQVDYDWGWRSMSNRLVDYNYNGWGWRNINDQTYDQWSKTKTMTWTIYGITGNQD